MNTIVGPQTTVQSHVRLQIAKQELQIANWFKSLTFPSVFHPCFIRGYFLVVSLVVPAMAGADEPKQSVIVVVGAEGSPDFGPQFRAWAEKWEAAAKLGGAEFTAIGLQTAADKSDREQLQERLAALAGAGSQAVWLVLIGHGTFDGKTARFNVRGSDVSATDLAQWLQPIERPLAVVNCTSASGPFLGVLSEPKRAVITSTRSGSEINFARFGEHLAGTIGDLAADLDKDEQTSLLEAFLAASAKTREFYASEGRLATEHSLLDDNGDKLGTPADWFQGVRPTKSAKDGAALDGLLAGQFVLVKSSREQQLPEAVRIRRDELELQLAELRKRKSQLAEEEYLKLLEPVLVELAKLYDAAEVKDPPAAHP